MRALQKKSTGNGFNPKVDVAVIAVAYGPGCTDRKFERIGRGGARGGVLILLSLPVSMLRVRRTLVCPRGENAIVELYASISYTLVRKIMRASFSASRFHSGSSNSASEVISQTLVRRRSS